MSQHDLVVDNSDGLTVRTDINNALQALGSLSSGTSAPATPYAYQLWADTTNSLLKMRNGANNAWVTVMSLASATALDLYANGSKAIEVDSSQNVKLSSTGAFRAPVGTTGQRPTAVQGQLRFNSSTNQFEGYDGTQWGSIGGAGNAVLDTFSGDGASTGFTLSSDPGSENNTIITISGVVQHKSTYSISGTTLTFSTAPPLGTNNIEVMYNVALAAGTPSDGTVTTAKLASGAVTSAKIDSTVAATNGNNTFTKAQRAGETTLTSSSNSIAIDLSLNNDFAHTFTENTTLANPTNIVVGQSGAIRFTQHASSPKTLAFGSYYDFAGGTAPTVTATNSARDTLFYYVRSATQIECSMVNNWS